MKLEGGGLLQRRGIERTFTKDFKGLIRDPDDAAGHATINRPAVDDHGDAIAQGVAGLVGRERGRLTTTVGTRDAQHTARRTQQRTHTVVIGYAHALRPAGCRNNQRERTRPERIRQPLLSICQRDADTRQRRRIRDKKRNRFIIGPAFCTVEFFHGGGMIRVRADAIDRICRRHDEATGLQGRRRLNHGRRDHAGRSDCTFWSPLATLRFSPRL